MKKETKGKIKMLVNLIPLFLSILLIISIIVMTAFFVHKRYFGGVV